MSTDPGAIRWLARVLLVALAKRASGVVGDLALRLRGGRGLRSRQRIFLLEDFRLELETAVEDAERHAISDEEAKRISLIRSLIRWLEHGELPGPDAIVHLEKQLGGIGRCPDEHEIIERTALVAAIYELGGNGRIAAGIWRKPDPDVSRDFGRTLHRQMRRAGLTVAELADRADLEPSAVVAYLYGTEQPRLEEVLRLAGAVGVEAEALLKGAAAAVAKGRPGRRAGLNRGRLVGDDEDARP